jgi:DNA-binding MarR family transcriptional regulator
MSLIAHIGNVPVEEWLPFLVPVVALYIYGRRRDHRRHEEVSRLLDAGEPLDDSTISAVLQQWSASLHKEVSIEHLPLLYPPGPDGVTPAELADRTHCDRDTVRRLLEDLVELGYVDLDEEKGSDEPRAWLTAEGADLVNLTEDTLLAAASRGSVDHADES